MLEDHKRTGAYFQAVMQNRRQFSGKTVLDVGTGSGILASFAARAGARKVYAVEATSMAQHARRLVQHNGVRTALQKLRHCCRCASPGKLCCDRAGCAQLAGVVEVIQGTIETVSLPEKVDVIISEWMGCAPQDNPRDHLLMPTQSAMRFLALSLFWAMFLCDWRGGVSLQPCASTL